MTLGSRAWIVQWRSAFIPTGCDGPCDGGSRFRLTPFPDRLTRIDPEQNMRRFYRPALQPDLFGGCTLTREWGQIGRGARLKLEEFPSEGR